MVAELGTHPSADALRERLFTPRLTESVHPVDRDLPQPGAERTVPTPLERRQFAKKDDEDLLGQVIDLMVQIGEAR